MEVLIEKLLNFKWEVEGLYFFEWVRFFLLWLDDWIFYLWLFIVYLYDFVVFEFVIVIVCIRFGYVGFCFYDVVCKWVCFFGF